MSQNIQVGESDGDARQSGPYRWRWQAFTVVLLASVMDLLDTLVTNVAAPTIRHDVGGGTVLLQWLGAGYTLAMAAGLITGGRLGDIFGRKRLFLIGVVGFTVSSALCASVASPGQLIAARVAQGLFGAIMLPQGLGVIKEVFPPQELATAFGAFGPVMGLSSVLGPALAGWLIDANYFGTGWRMIFLINLPIGLIALVGAVRFLPRTRETTASRVDLAGAGLVSAAALLLVFPVVQGRELGWPAWTFVSMAGSVVLFGVFGWYEVHKKASGGEPLIIPGLFRKRAYSGGLAAGLSYFTALVGFSLIFTVFLQVGLGYTPLKAGLSALPQAIGAVLGFIAAGAGLGKKFGRTLIHTGTVMSFLGILVFFVVLHAQGSGIAVWQVIPALLLMGAGMGLVMSQFFDIVLAGVEPHETGSASGTLTALQQFGSSLGIAVLGTIFFGLLGGQVSGAVTDLSGGLHSELTAAGVPAARQNTIVATLGDCEHDSAVSKDPTVQPASCAHLTGIVGAASPGTDRAKVAAAVGAAAKKSSREGFVAAMEETIWVAAGLQALTFLLAFLLPMRAREEPGPGGGEADEWAAATPT